MYVTLPNLLCFESVFTHLTWNCLVIHNWVEQKTETQNPSYSEFLAVFYSTRLDFNVFPYIHHPKFINQNYFFFLFHEVIYSEDDFWNILLVRSNNQLQFFFIKKIILLFVVIANSNVYWQLLMIFAVVQI